MISLDLVIACAVISCVSFFAGASVALGSDGTVRRWLELRHELKLKALEQRARWLDEGKP